MDAIAEETELDEPNKVPEAGIEAEVEVQPPGENVGGENRLKDPSPSLASTQEDADE